MYVYIYIGITGLCRFLLLQTTCFLFTQPSCFPGSCPNALPGGSSVAGCTGMVPEEIKFFTEKLGRSLIWRFPKMGVPPKWMVYKGKSY